MKMPKKYLPFLTFDEGRTEPCPMMPLTLPTYPAPQPYAWNSWNVDGEPVHALSTIISGKPWCGYFKGHFVPLVLRLKLAKGPLASI